MSGKITLVLQGRLTVTERSEIVRVLEQAYAARKQGHMDSILAVFDENAPFRAVGAAAPAVGRVEQKSAIQNWSMPSSCWTTRSIAW